MAIFVFIIFYYFIYFTNEFEIIDEVWINFVLYKIKLYKLKHYVWLKPCLLEISFFY